MIRPPPSLPLFPYTTLFRSYPSAGRGHRAIEDLGDLGRDDRGRTPGAQQDPVPVGLDRSEEHTSELQSRGHLVCRLLLEKKKRKTNTKNYCNRLKKRISHLV